MSQNDHERQIAYMTSALQQANATLDGTIAELSLVRRVGDAVSQHTSVSSLSLELVDAISEAINCKYVLIYAGPESGSFELQAASSVFAAGDKFPESVRGTSILRRLEETRTPIQIDDVETSAHWSKDWPFPEGFASWLFVPLLARNDLRGVLCLADDVAAAFDERTLRTLMVVAPQISSSLANIGLYNHLRESEKKYRSLVEGIPDVVYICDQNWNIIETNPAAEALFGQRIVDTLLSNLFASMNAASLFVASVHQSRVVQNFETELLRNDGKRIVTLLSCVKNGDRYSGVIKDLTERTRLLEQVTHAQKMESIGTMASGVAHDFNNILGIILPSAQLIKSRTEPSAPIQEFADVIVNASKRAAGLTKQLLSLSRKDAITLRVLDVNDSIIATGKLLGETLDRKIQLEFDLDPNIMFIKADETQIEQVLLNLAINARDAMPGGGRIRFRTRTENDKVVVRVSDNGSGIDKNILPKIFDPFFTTKEKSKGTGLGLSVVYGIVKQMSGTIEVESTVDIGTEFILTFPPCDEEMKPAGDQEARLVGGTEKILIVDDEPDILMILGTSLQGLGYTVVSAKNGIEAIEFASEDIDLIILDVIMPVMDGVTALRGIRQKTPNVRVIVSSGYTSPEKMPVLERIGVEGFVTKPFDLNKLAITVRDVLDGVVV